MTRSLTLTAWPSLINTTGESVSVSTEEILRWVRSPQVFATKEEAPGYSLGTFRDDRRGGEHAEAMHALVLDDDSGLNTVEATASKWAAFSGVVYSTYSATVDAPRTRTIIFTSRDMAPAEYAIVWLHVRDLAKAQGITLDAKTKDVSRFWFVPSVPPGGVFSYAELDGEPLDVDALLASDRVNPPRGGFAEPRSSNADIRKSAAALLGSAWPERGRHSAQLALAGALAHDHWSEPDALEMLCDVCRHAGDENRPKRASTVRNTFERYRSDNTVQGWTALQQYVPSAVVGAARDLLDPVKGLAREVTKSLAAESTPANDTTTFLTPAQRARRVGGKDIVRLSSGLPTLDLATRGGLLLRKVVGIGGAPGAGKTALAVQMAYGWLARGVHVAFLAADEDADSILIRFGQLAGLSRDLLENGDATTRAALAAWCESVPFMLLDGDDVASTVEDVSEALVGAAKGKPSALVVDSLQTVRTREVPPKGSDLRVRANVVVRALKHAAKVDGHLVVTTSEIARSAYRNQDQAQNANPLAAFKESGDIEYGMGLAFVLTSRQGSKDLVDAEVVKNRLGYGKPTILLRLDHPRAAISETETTAADTSDPLYFVKDEVMAYFAENPFGGLTKTQIYDRVGGRKVAVWKAIDQLLDEKRLHHDRRKGIRLPLPGDPGYTAVAS